MDARKQPEFFINILALAGSAIVIIVLLWGLAHITGWTVSKFSSFVSRENIEKPLANTESAAPEPEISESIIMSDPIQLPDLYVRIVRTGVSNMNEAYVVFDIINSGSAPTGAWHFTASVPTTGQSQLYTSPLQSPLASGAHIENTLRFAPRIPGTFAVSIDPENRVKESNESNNAASMYLSY